MTILEALSKAKKDLAVFPTPKGIVSGAVLLIDAVGLLERGYPLESEFEEIMERYDYNIEKIPKFELGW